MMNTTVGNSSETVFYPQKLKCYYGCTIIVVTSLSVLTCIIVIIALLRTTSGNFFGWRVLDRFSMYNVAGDFLYYTAQIAYGVHHSVVGRLYARNPTGLSCTLHAILLFEFASAQIYLGLIMAIYAFVLICFNRNISFGRYDYRLLVPLFIIPLIILVTAAFFDQFRPNIAYCGFKEERGVMTWHFLAFFLLILISFIVIVVLYTTMWCYVHWTAKKNSAVLKQQSAVNSKRLAFKLSLYVAIYAVQFCGHIVEGIWSTLAEIPEVVRFVVIMLSVTGGIMNGIVYATIRK